MCATCAPAPEVPDRICFDNDGFDGILEKRNEFMGFGELPAFPSAISPG